jgi:hypothetical protein
MLSYQANAKAGQWVAKHGIEEDRFAGFITGGPALNFYARRVVPWRSTLSEAQAFIRPGVVIYADELRLEELHAAGSPPDSVMAFPHYPVQTPDGRFLRSDTRDAAITRRYLLFY